MEGKKKWARRFIVFSLAIVFFFILTSCGLRERVEKRDEADAAVRMYVADQWPDSDFQPEYYFNLFGSTYEYYYRAVSQSSPDTWFTIIYNSERKACTDFYEDGMAATENGIHTAERLARDYENTVAELLRGTNYPHSPQISYHPQLFAQAWEEGKAAIDMKFDPALDLGWTISFQVIENSPTNQNVIEAQAKDIYAILTAEDYRFQQYEFIVTWRQDGKEGHQTLVITLDADGLIIRDECG